MPPDDIQVEVPVPKDIKLISQVVVQDVCDAPEGHCYGSPGKEQEVWTLSVDKLSVLKKEVYTSCKYCGKYVYEKEAEAQQATES